MLAFGIRRIEASGPAQEDGPLLVAEVSNLKDEEYEHKDVRIQA